MKFLFFSTTKKKKIPIKKLDMKLITHTKYLDILKTW